MDTSVWSLAFRRQAAQLSAEESAVLKELTALVNDGRARLIGLIRQELLSGIKSPTQFEQLRAQLRSFLDETVETSDYEQAALASNICRSKGVASSPVDILICAIAIGRGWSILSTDPDFSTYARVLPLHLHRIHK